MQLLNSLFSQIENTFRKHPCQFFTEHDIHTQLALIAIESLKESGSLYARTCDGCVVSRVHHEYPTPFRCIMKGSDFKLIPEEKFREEKENRPEFRARRGFLDFVIINAEYISSNKLSVVSGKRYRDLLENSRDRQSVALDLAIEVVYYPALDERLHAGIMDRRVSSIKQDYQKLVALMEFKTNNVSYCREAAMMFFSNIKHKDQLKKKIANIQKHGKVSLYSIFAQ